MSKYQTIALDPPWKEVGGGNRGADAHYPVMHVQDMPAVILGSTVWKPDPAGCSLWMWATKNHLEDALWLIKELGATYVTKWIWVKLAPSGDALAMGLGQRSRSAHEDLLYARIGTVPVPPPDRRSFDVIFAVRREHSRKPDEAYEVIEQHDPPDARRLEMFARTQRAGWDCWGNEVYHVE